MGFGLCLLVCKDQEVALEESETRLAKLQMEREKEAEVKRRRADELKQLMEREERSRREKEVRGGQTLFLFLTLGGKREEEQMCVFSLQLLEQRVKSLQSNIEAERGAHLETKFNSEIVQVTNAQSRSFNIFN